MSLTDRDRKILMALVPLAILAAYWFLVLAPKREESATVQDQLTQAESERDTAVSKLTQLTAAKHSFADDYATVIYLGKAVPSNVDMPSLIVQLDRAARGTGIRFSSVKTGERAATGTGATDTTTSKPATGSGTGGPGNVGSGAPAQSGPGQAAQTANKGAQAADNASANSASAANSTGSTATPGAAGASTAPVGLDSIPLDFEFRGSFFDLADFFHRMKRFVRVANDKVLVRGRLMTINSFSFETEEDTSGLVAKVHTTVYLAPKAQGVNAGATPQGPAGAPPATPPGGATASKPSTPAPAAVVSP